MSRPGPSRRAPGVRAEGKARTRERLLDAAAQVFADNGYGAASVEEIARVADVSVGSIYTHFRSKQKLFVALMDRRRLAETGSTEEDRAGGLEAAVERLGEQVVRLADDRHGALLAAEVWLFAVRDASFGADLAEHHRRLVDDLGPLVAAERARRGADWALSDAEVARVVLALFTGMVQHRRLTPSAAADDLYGRAVTALLDGLDRG